MIDRARLEQLILAHHSCLTVVTVEEEHFLQLLRAIAIEASREMFQWTVTDGLRDSILSGATPIQQTEHPAAALYHLAHNVNGPVLCVMLDLAGHLKDELTLRMLRETIERFERIGAMLVLVNACGDLPQSITSVATVFDLSFPDKDELESILRESVRKLTSERQIQVNLTRQGLNTIIRNLQGLTRQQRSG